MDAQTVLIVEDDEVIRETLAQILQDHSYHVTTAQHGRDALEKMASMPCPCLLLMDLMMPIMNGWELLTELRRDERWSRLPVIILSAGGEANDLLQDPYVRFLKKPLRMASLLEAVRTSCSLPDPTP
jgi:CheY-like chemotaxis protein